MSNSGKNPKSELEKEIYKYIGEQIFQSRKETLKLSREKLEEKIVASKLGYGNDKEFFSISNQMIKHYELGSKESPISKFFIIAILLDMDLNKLKNDIGKNFHIFPFKN